MKKLGLIVAFITGALFLGSCEGPTGPDGRPGDVFYGRVFERNGVNFDRSNNRTQSDISIQHPYDLGRGDAVFVFYKDGTDANNNPIWTPLPRKYETEITDGAIKRKSTIEYFYNFTPGSVDIFAKSEDALRFFHENQALSFTDNLSFRLVYVYGDDPVTIRSNAQSLDDRESKESQSYDYIINKYHLQDAKVQTIN